MNSASNLRMQPRNSIIVLLLIMHMGAVTAQETPGFTVSPMAGYTWLGENIDDTGHWSLGIGYQFDNPWAVEFVYANAKTDFESLPLDVDFARWHLDGLYHLNTWGKVRPYLSFGLGEGEYDIDTLSSENETLINVGTGIKYAFAEHTSFRADLKLFHGNDFDAADAAIAVGIHHVFARSMSASAPAPTPAPLDSDRDGVNDNLDRCPTTSLGVLVDGRGCEQDDDNDGVLNSVDACPDTTNRKASIDKEGCYVRLMETVAIELEVEFDFDSSAQRPSHKAEVKRVFEFMEKYPETTVVIEGHTDNQGNDAYNKQLSQARADTIANMLVSEFGVEGDRVKSIGLGEERPIASNSNEAGRQENRRVIGIVEAKVETIETIETIEKL